MVDTAPPIVPWVCAATLGVATIVGCADVTEVTAYDWQITDAQSGLFIVGATVCEVDAESLQDIDNCDETDLVGSARVRVPSNQEVAFSIRKPGYGSILRADVSDANYGANASGTGVAAAPPLYPDEQLKALAEQQLGAQYPWEGGVVGLTRTGSGVLGDTFAPVGATAGEVGDLFYYDAGSGEYRVDLQGTTEQAQSGALLPLHSGGFTRVTPGEHVFELGGTFSACPNPCVSWGWPADAPTRVRVPVRAGHITYASIICDCPQ